MRQDDTGTFHYEPPRRRIRFMFTDGTFADVVTERDDSDMRAALLVAVNPGVKKDDWKTIAGHANLEDEGRLL